MAISLASLQRGKRGGPPRLLIHGEHGLGKCVSGRTTLIDPVGGRLTTIQALVDRGDGLVLTMKEAGQIVPQRPAAYLRNEPAQLYRLVTQTGRDIEATANHPFLTREGWKPLAELGASDHVAVVTEYPSLGEKGHILFEEVQSVEPTIIEVVYDLTIDGSHSFIANDFVIHNSTFASQAPNPVFIPTEDGLSAIDTTAFPLAKSYQDVLDALAALLSEEHAHDTVIIDSLDWLEALIWEYVAKEAGRENIESFGYQRGYALAADRFREVLAGLGALRDRKGMAVILIAHSTVKRFDDPAYEPYDRYTLKLHPKAAGPVLEWVDIVGFVAQELVVKKVDVGFQKKAARGIGTGRHVLHLKRTPAFDSKNRFGLPDTLPLSWSAFAEAFAEAHQATPTKKES